MKWCLETRRHEYSQGRTPNMVLKNTQKALKTNSLITTVVKQLHFLIDYIFLIH